VESYPENYTKTLLVFINRCLRRIINIKWPEATSNEDLWKITIKRSILNKIKKRKWRWSGHSLRKLATSIQKMALDLKPQGAQRRGRPKKDPEEKGRGRSHGNGEAIERG
jgi:hypothetical protein